jgi:hypothetical protein
MRSLQLKNKRAVVLILLLGATRVLYAQESAEEKPVRHKLSFLMAYGLIPEHSIEGKSTEYLFIVPTVGINYDFIVTPKFGLGLHTDVILQKFEVEELKDNLIIERVFPVTTNLIASYRPNENWSFLAGGGAELEKNKNFPMLCVGAEYGFEIRESWELGFNFMFEHRLEAYNSYLLGISFTKSFMPK